MLEVGTTIRRGGGSAFRKYETVYIIDSVTEPQKSAAENAHASHASTDLSTTSSSTSVLRSCKLDVPSWILLLLQHRALSAATVPFAQLMNVQPISFQATSPKVCHPLVQHRQLHVVPLLILN